MVTSVDEALGYAFGILDQFGLTPVVTAGFIVVVAAVGGKALITFLRE